MGRVMALPLIPGVPRELTTDQGLSWIPQFPDETGM